MLAHSVVVNLDVLKEGRAGLLMGGKACLGGTFPLQRSEEPLHYGIIPAITFATHADAEAMVLQKRLVRLAGVTSILDRNDGVTQPPACGE